MKTSRYYYNVCDRCGANLDPGERCDCEQSLFLPGTTTEDKKEGRKDAEPEKMKKGA